MGSWTAFYVHDRSVDLVARCCQAWLHANRGWRQRLLSREVVVAQREYADCSLGWSLLTMSARPSGVIVCGSEPWVTVIYDRFYRPNALAHHVSSALGTRVVDTQGQTTSDAYLVEVYEGGESRRRLEFAVDEGWIEQFGEPFPGEPAPLESPCEDEPDEPELAWFEHRAVTRYLDETFGIAWWAPPDAKAPVTLVSAR